MKIALPCEGKTLNKSFSFLLVSCEIAFRDKLAIVVKMTTLHIGSLGSGVDEERSKLRVGM